MNMIFGNMSLRIVPTYMCRVKLKRFDFYICKREMGHSNILSISPDVLNHRKYHRSVEIKKMNKSYLYESLFCLGNLLPNLKSLEYSKINIRLMAGHSKWQNIRHIKAAKDKDKSILHSKYARLFRYAIQEGGPEPKLNHKLATLIEEARKNNVPSSVTENALKKANNSKMKTGQIEIGGPGGCHVIIAYETDNISIMRHSIKQICKKHFSTIIPGEGRWRAFYEKKGILIVTKTNDGKPVDVEKMVDAAIDAGSEDVQCKVDEKGKHFAEFYCEWTELYVVKKALEDLSYMIDDAYVGYIAHLTVQLSEEDMVLAGNFLSELEEMQDVSRLYENIQ